MSCNTCPQFKTLPSCLESLVVGTVTGHPDEDLYVYIKNMTTGYLARYSASTDSDALLDLNIENLGISPNHDYNLWVTLQSAANIHDELPFTIDSTAYTCARFTFELIHNGDALSEYASQTLTPVE